MRPLRSFALDDPERAPAGPALCMLAAMDVRRLESLQLRCAGGVPRGLQESSLPRLADARLRRLHLSAVATFDPGLVAQVLQGQRHLEDLELGGLMARERMADVVGAAIHAPLKRLSVPQTGAGWGAALAEMLPHWPALEALDLSYNHFAGEELAAVLDALPTTGGLRSLLLSGAAALREFPSEALLRAIERGCLAGLREVGLLSCRPLDGATKQALGEELGGVQDLAYDSPPGTEAGNRNWCLLVAGAQRAHVFTGTPHVDVVARFVAARRNRLVSLELSSIEATNLLMLLDSPYLETLERLHIKYQVRKRDFDGEIAPSRAHPRLRSLWLPSEFVLPMLLANPLPALRELTMPSLIMDGEAMATALATRAPGVEYLYWGGSPDGLRPVLRAGALPRLRELHIPANYLTFNEGMMTGEGLAGCYRDGAS